MTFPELRNSLMDFIIVFICSIFGPYGCPRTATSSLHRACKQKMCGHITEKLTKWINEKRNNDKDEETRLNDRTTLEDTSNFICSIFGPYGCPRTATSGLHRVCKQKMYGHITEKLTTRITEQRNITKKITKSETSTTHLRRILMLTEQEAAMLDQTTWNGVFENALKTSARAVQTSFFGVTPTDPVWSLDFTLFSTVCMQIIGKTEADLNLLQLDFNLVSRP